VSFRLRLTLASAAAVALAVAVACAIAYIVVGQRLYGQVDSALRAEATAAAPAEMETNKTNKKNEEVTSGRLTTINFLICEKGV